MENASKSLEQLIAHYEAETLPEADQWFRNEGIALLQLGSQTQGFAESWLVDHADPSHLFEFRETNRNGVHATMEIRFSELGLRFLNQLHEIESACHNVEQEKDKTRGFPKLLGDARFDRSSRVTDFDSALAAQLSNARQEKERLKFPKDKIRIGELDHRIGVLEKAEQAGEDCKQRKQLKKWLAGRDQAIAAAQTHRDDVVRYEEAEFPDAEPVTELARKVKTTLRAKFKAKTLQEVQAPSKTIERKPFKPNPTLRTISVCVSVAVLVLILAHLARRGDQATVALDYSNLPSNPDIADTVDEYGSGAMIVIAGDRETVESFARYLNGELDDLEKELASDGEPLSAQEISEFRSIKWLHPGNIRHNERLTGLLDVKPSPRSLPGLIRSTLERHRLIQGEIRRIVGVLKGTDFSSDQDRIDQIRAEIELDLFGDEQMTESDEIEIAFGAEGILSPK